MDGEGSVWTRGNGAGESRRPKHRVPDRSPGTRGGLVGLRLRRGLYNSGARQTISSQVAQLPGPPRPPVVWTVSFAQAAGPRDPTYAYRGPGYYGYGAAGRGTGVDRPPRFPFARRQGFWNGGEAGQERWTRKRKRSGMYEHGAGSGLGAR